MFILAKPVLSSLYLQSLLYHVYVSEASFIMFIFAKPALSCIYLRSLLYHV